MAGDSANATSQWGMLYVNDAAVGSSGKCGHDHVRMSGAWPTDLGGQDCVFERGGYPIPL